MTGVQTCALPISGDFWVDGQRGGVDIEVLIRNGEIWTGYPTNMGISP